MPPAHFIVALILLAVAAPARADVRGPEPARQGAATTGRQAGDVRRKAQTGRPQDPLYTDTIDKVSARVGVDPRLVRAVIQVESAYQPDARSPKGAMGLMQLMPETARQYALANAYDPVANIEAGVRHLKSLLTRLPVHLALAAYNAGEAAVERFSGIPPFRETQDYVARVLQVAAGNDNYTPVSGWASVRSRSNAPAARRFSFGNTSRNGPSLPLRAARGPWRQGQPVPAPAR